MLQIISGTMMDNNTVNNVQEGYMKEKEDANNQARMVESTYQ